MQLVGNIIRPAPTHSLRAWWNLLHHVFGRATLVIGFVNVALGIYLYTYMYGDDSWKVRLP